MNSKTGKSKWKWRLILLSFLIFIIFINLDVIFPIKRFDTVDQKDSVKGYVRNPSIKSYRIVYSIYTSNSGISLATMKDILNVLNKNSIDIAFITDCNPLSDRLEGIYGKKLIISKCKSENKNILFEDIKISTSSDTDCLEIFNLTKSVKFDIVHISSLFKFFIFQIFNKERAYNNLLDFVEINISPKWFSQESCFISGVGFYRKFSYISGEKKLFLLDENHTLPLVINKIYTNEYLSSDINFSKKLIKKALKDGNLISLFSKEFDADVFIEENNVIKPVGSIVNKENNPVIFVSSKKGNILLAVYKNGRQKYVYNSSNIALNKLSEGFYTLIAYRYSFKLPGNIFLGVYPIGFLGNVFVQ